MRAGGLLQKVWKKRPDEFYIGSRRHFDMIFFSSESSNRDLEKNKIFVAGRIFWDPRNFYEFRSSPIFRSNFEENFSELPESSENELRRRATVQNASPGSREPEKNRSHMIPGRI